MRALLLALSLAVVVLGCGSADPAQLGGAAGGNGATGNPGDSTGDVGDPAADAPLAGADDSAAQPVPPDTVAPGATTLVTNANVNLRQGPATTFAVIAVIPSGATVTRLDPAATNGFLHVAWNGSSGWGLAAYFEAAAATSGGTAPGGKGTTSPAPAAGIDLEGPTSPANAIARAKASVGFSYWWGGGAWLPAGPKGAAGSCTGNCPSCSHSGKYGADCSGMVAKAWQFGTKALESNSHPYSTASFINDVAGKWSTVSRGALKPGDALVHNSGGSGHIVLWEKGDGWGASTVYECKGCAYGCVHDTRTFTSDYKGIRRAGF